MSSDANNLNAPEGAINDIQEITITKSLVKLIFPDLGRITIMPVSRLIAQIDEDINRSKCVVEGSIR